MLGRRLREREITLGFKANAVGVREIGPSAEWYESESDAGWMHSSAKVSHLVRRRARILRLTRLQGDERKVVYFGGIYRQYRNTTLKSVSLHLCGRGNAALG